MEKKNFTKILLVLTLLFTFGYSSSIFAQTTCPIPTDLIETNITTTTADLEWTENGTSSTWFIEWGTTGFSLGSGTLISGITTTNYQLIGLLPSTTYDWYVSSDCSDWAGPSTFTTLNYPCNADADFTFTDQGNMQYYFATIANIDLAEYAVDWDFDDGNVASGIDATHTFAAAGSYDVSCYVYSLVDPNCTALVTYTVVISSGLPWPEPTVTSTNHTILVPVSANITIDGTPIADGSYLGVFFNDANGDLVCGGYVYYETNGNNLFLSAWGADVGFDGFAANEEFKWKIWDVTTASEFDADATYDLSGAFPNDAYFVGNGMSGVASLSAITSQTQDIVINTGWNIISTYIDPFEPSLDSAFAAIASEVIIVKDGLGMVYWPLYFINAIGDLTIGEGYQVKMTTTQTLSVVGYAVVPELSPISIPEGWSIFGYLRQSPASVETLLSQIVANTIIVKDALGMVYWPFYGINAIGDLDPGQGYQIKTDLAVTLTYLANSVSSKTEVFIPTPVRYTETSNTGNNMTLGIPSKAWDTTPSQNSEIGVFNLDGKLLGSTVYTGENISIAIWGDDFTTDEIEGIVDGENYSIVLWDYATNDEYQLEVVSWIEGDEFFTNNGISVVEEFKATALTNSLSALYQNMPNPFSQTTTIKFFLAESSDVQIKLYNPVGELLEILVSENYDAGEYLIEFNSGHYASGTYYYKIEAENFVSTKSMIIQK